MSSTILPSPSASLAEPLLRNLAEIGSEQGFVGWVEQGETQHTQPKFLSSIRRRLRRLSCSVRASLE